MVGQIYPAIVDKDISWLDIPMDDTVSVNAPQGFHKAAEPREDHLYIFLETAIAVALPKELLEVVLRSWCDV
ncbi:hypothetical protein SLS59_006997 [Nothophoma quercina]|uniref:Uncharacterized protein n=1 Tax=Nothophoma quercina TaxID=749835 RepID=A0ABR3R1L3_9PLEO